jgi:hypothetical protein
MIFLRLIHTAMLLVFLCLAACSKEAASRPGPSSLLKPEDVVRTVMTALKNNDHPSPDSGIATAFEFASPQNKRQTGPLERFISMVKTAGYRPMLNFLDIEYSPVVLHGDQAEQIVRIKTREKLTATYVFMLRKQRDGVYKNCWMTDGVMRLRDQPATRPAPDSQPEPGTPPEPEAPQRPAEPV